MSPEAANRNLLSKASLSPFISAGGGVQGQDFDESSPYKSKFNVLKFSPDKSSQKSLKKKKSSKKPSPFKSPTKTL